MPPACQALSRKRLRNEQSWASSLPLLLSEQQKPKVEDHHVPFLMVSGALREDDQRSSTSLEVDQTCPSDKYKVYWSPHSAVFFENLGEKAFYIAELEINSTLQIPSPSDFAKNASANCGMWDKAFSSCI